MSGQKIDYLNTQCQSHNKICEYICSFSECHDRLICHFCKNQHLKKHSQQFVYPLMNIKQIHNFNKVDKLKGLLMKQKIKQQIYVKNLYQGFLAIIQPLSKSVLDFIRESQQLANEQLNMYLRANWFIINQISKKSDKTNELLNSNNPALMVEQIVNEIQHIKGNQEKLLGNGQSYKWYIQSTSNLLKEVASELKSMVKLCQKLLKNGIVMQANKYSGVVYDDKEIVIQRPMNRVSSLAELARLEIKVAQQHKLLGLKDDELNAATRKIREQATIIDDLKEQVKSKEQIIKDYKERDFKDEQKRIEQEKRRRQEKYDKLVSQKICQDADTHLCFKEKPIRTEDFQVAIQQCADKLITLDLTNHRLTKEQLERVYKLTDIQVLKLNFIPLLENQTENILKCYKKLVRLELNSCMISDSLLAKIAKAFTQSLRQLYLMDNKISDNGLQKMFSCMEEQKIEELFVSYNELTSNSIEIIRRSVPAIKVLHIAKNSLRQKNIVSFKYLVHLEELYIGNSGLTREGLQIISRNCKQIKRLSLVGCDCLNDTVVELIIEMEELTWLDLSYCKLSSNQITKINKVKKLHRDLKIVML